MELDTMLGAVVLAQINVEKGKEIAIRMRSVLEVSYVVKAVDMMTTVPLP